MCAKGEGEKCSGQAWKRRLGRMSKSGSRDVPEDGAG